jgi:hypothetical protein
MKNETTILYPYAHLSSAGIERVWDNHARLYRNDQALPETHPDTHAIWNGGCGRVRALL